MREVFEIIDLSTNGTYLNNVRLEKGVPKQVKDGDKIGIVVKENVQENQKGQFIKTFDNKIMY